MASANTVGQRFNHSPSLDRVTYEDVRRRGVRAVIRLNMSHCLALADILVNIAREGEFNFEDYSAIQEEGYKEYNALFTTSSRPVKVTRQQYLERFAEAFDKIFFAGGLKGRYYINSVESIRAGLAKCATLDAMGRCRIAIPQNEESQSSCDRTKLDQAQNAQLIRDLGILLSHMTSAFFRIYACQCNACKTWETMGQQGHGKAFQKAISGIAARTTKITGKDECEFGIPIQFIIGVVEEMMYFHIDPEDEVQVPERLLRAWGVNRGVVASLFRAKLYYIRIYLGFSIDHEQI